jgi:hypothetical protein
MTMRQEQMGPLERLGLLLVQPLLMVRYDFSYQTKESSMNFLRGN